MSKSEQTSANKPSSGMMKTVIVMLCIILVTIGATLYFAAPQALPSWMPFTASAVATEHKPVAVQPPPVVVPAPIFLELEPFTVTLRDAQNRRRVLYVALTLRVGSQTDSDMFTEYMPAVRDRILRKLLGQDPVEVQTPHGRMQLAQALIHTLQIPYHPQLSAPSVHDVLFTAFVVQ